MRDELHVIAVVLDEAASIYHTVHHVLQRCYRIEQVLSELASLSVQVLLMHLPTV